MKITYNFSLNIFNKKFAPKETTSFDGVKFFMYHVNYNNDIYSVIIGIDLKRKDSILINGVNKGIKSVKDYTSSLNILKDGWQIGLPCEFDEAEDDVSLIIIEYNSKEYTIVG